MKKREKMWEEIEEAKAKSKAEHGLCLIVVMAFVFSIMYACSPDPVCAKGSRSSSRSSSRSYSKPVSNPAPRKVTQQRRVDANKKAVARQRIQLAKKPAVVTAVATGAVVGAYAVNHKQDKNNATTKTQVKRKRVMKKGMYERNGMVCKKNKYTRREKCKSKAAYFFDDVLDADDWFEDDDDDYRQPQQYQQQQPVQQSSGIGFFGMLVMFGLFLTVTIVVVILVRRK